MNKLFPGLIICFLIVSKTYSQAVTITNPTNTSPNLSANYASLSAALSDLNSITTISGPVIVTLNPGNNQTAPAGGYVIQFSASTTASNYIIIRGSSNTITAFAPQATGGLNDGIFKIIGADHITIENFIMQENTANVINSPATSNNMTEWGVALLRATPTDGAQNNIIQNNTISLNRNYRNSFGIYSNARHTAIAPTIVSDATNVTGSNAGNSVYGNSINNVMFGITFIGSATPAYHDAGNDIGGSSAATGNSITNWGGNTALSSFASNLLGSACIYTNHQVSDNISYNVINSGVVGTGVSVAAFSGIRKHYSTSPIGTFTSTISNNTITMTSDFTGGAFDCIRSQGMSSLSTATINITNNKLINNSISAISTSVGFSGIINDSSPGSLSISDNIIRGFTAATLNTFIVINQAGTIVNNVDINNNKIGDAVSGALTSTVSSNGNLYGIYNANGSSTAIVNINNNSMDGFSVVNAGQIGFIYNVGNSAVANINHNQMGTVTSSLINFTGVQAFNMDVIYNGTFTTTSVSIQHNDITGINNNVTSTASQSYINCAAPSQLSTTISNNTFTNLIANTSNAVTLITRASNMVTGSNSIINNNSIIGGFSKTASGNIVSLCTSSSLSVAGSTTTISSNNFSNVSVTGSTILYGIRETDGASGANSPNKSITGNTINNVSLGSGTFYGLLVDRGPSLNITSNTISNILSSGITIGIAILSAAANTSGNISANTISSLTSSADEVNGIRNLSTSTALNIYDNLITGLSSAGSSKNVNGIYFSAGHTMNVYDNIISNLTGTGVGASTINGIWVSNGTTVNIYRNKIHSLAQNGVVSASPAVNGILFSNGLNVTAHNNFVANLNAPNTDLDDAVRGLSITSAAVSSTYSLFYNSIYINANSSGTNFGTSGIYHLTNTTATTAMLNMIDNIVVNTSDPNGTGITAAFRRSSATLDNYATTSDYNLFYAGIASANNLIYYDGTAGDQTLPAYKTRVSPRDANTISLMPNFVSSTDLHLTSANCGIDGKGTAISINSDIDSETRNVSTPDIGADEFTAALSTNLAGVISTAVCENKIVSGTGTTYTNSSCEIIARIIPSGADPVGGAINVCVTLDPTQQFFNGEPYVQRHYDIEPVITNQTTTSATIILYFTNSEFLLYNTTNPAWPALPTFSGDPNIANLKVTQFHGTPIGGLPTSSPGNYTGTRVLITPSSVILNGSVWEVTVNIAGFSGFYVHTNLWNSPLPVTLNYFKGNKHRNAHLLSWKITCNTSSVTMFLERSPDRINFTTISNINTDAIRCEQPFNYADTQPLDGINYYRLKFTDATGHTRYSSVLALLNLIKEFEIINIAPNPINNNVLRLNLTAIRASMIELRICDIQGRLMQKQVVPVQAGQNSLSVPVSTLSPGTYSIQLGTTDKSKLQRFVKQ